MDEYIVEDRRKNECPVCHCKILYFNGKEVCCAAPGCTWEGKTAKRVDDHKLSTLQQIREAWGEA